MNVMKLPLIPALGLTGFFALFAPVLSAEVQSVENIQLGVRPFYLIDNMDEGKLRDELSSCANGPFKKSEFSIGHRGAAMQFPEHTRESYIAAARQGAGILECDVTFTKDRELVCRHSQCDLHTTTNILATPLADKCSEGFTPAEYDEQGNITRPANAKCCTSDLTLAEFRTLNGKMDGADKGAKTVEAFLQGTAGWRTDLYATTGTLMTHKESIELFQQLGVKMTPELKAASVDMPYEGEYSQANYAQQMIDEYKAAKVPADQVFAQSFNLDDVLYWLENEPEFGQQAVFLDDMVYPENEGGYDKAVARLPELKEKGVKYVAPPMFALVTNKDGKITASGYAKTAKAQGLNLITWTLERSGPLAGGGGWYYTGINDITNNDGDMFSYLDVLAQEAGVKGVFSDWPATTTYYANCKGL